MITINLYYKGTNGSARAFAAEMESSGIVAAIRAEAGNLRYEYFQPLDDPETILLIDSWVDQEAIDAHHASPMMAQIAELREKYDLQMKAERFLNDDSGTDEKYIRKCGGGDERSGEKAAAGNSNGYEFVDLGLSVKWASMNVGADKISDHGGYFAWGETDNKDDYTWSAYKHGSSADNLTKYNFMDNGLALEAADDAAAVNWGGAWRMPTGSEWEELCSKRNCTWEWTSIENASGYRITSKKAGFTDKSIFLPAAGYYRGCSIEGAASSAYYWSSTRNEPFPDRALCLYFIPNFVGTGNNGFRNGGFSVRPVIK